jgi:hypothetical protein
MAITVKLIGGLGNQLFGYFAGRYLADKLRTDLILDFHQQKNNPHKGSSITDFKIDDCFTHQITNGQRIETLVNLMPRRIVDLDNAARALFKVHISRNVGFDPRLELVRDGSYVSGYFQTFRYFVENPIQTKGSPLELVRPGTWFKKMQSEAKETSPTVLHVRRGDYSKELNRSMGQLSVDFFFAALAKLEYDFDNPNREVWVFSDSIPQVKEEFGDRGTKFRFVEPPESSTAAENLILMGSGSSLVISNSTFSYWSGLMGQVPVVLAPKKWFQELGDPLDLVPHHWHQVESVWL